MKAKLNPMFEQVSGQLGDLVFRVMRGRTVISRKSLSATDDPTPGQVEQRQRFKQAVEYGKNALANESLRALYEAAAKQKNMPAFALTVADYFHAPTVSILDLSAYNGQTGDLIFVTASDDFGVAGVHVSITDSQDTLIENGEAALVNDGSGRWSYAAQNTIPEGITVNVKAVATDHPGGTALKTATKSF